MIAPQMQVAGSNNLRMSLHSSGPCVEPTITIMLRTDTNAGCIDVRPAIAIRIGVIPEHFDYIVLFVKQTQAMRNWAHAEISSGETRRGRGAVAKEKNRAGGSREGVLHYVATSYRE